MPCESCAVQFSVFRRRRACPECERWYCAACLRRGGGAMCAACRALSTRPLARSAIAHLKVRDLQAFLQRQNVSTRGCVEKEELLTLCVIHVNGSTYRRRSSRGNGTGAFSSLKGLTTNINEFLNQTFVSRPTAHPAPAPPPHNNTSDSNNVGCHNSSHTHGPAPARPPPPTIRVVGSNATGSDSRWRTEQFTRPPGFEAPPPGAGAGAGSGDTSLSSRTSSGSVRVDTADCFEVEDLDDSGWELVARPADPLPNDSEILLTEEQNIRLAEEERRTSSAASPSPNLATPAETRSPPPEPRPPPPEPVAPPSELLVPPPDPVAPPLDSLEPPPVTPQRAASALDLRQTPSPDNDTSSLKDEPMFNASSERPRISLSALQSASELTSLSVRQLKELLSANRVQYRGALERADLLERAQALYREHARYRNELETLPLEECCKICMAAPLECVLLECGHMAVCTECGKRLAECPICRRYVSRAVRVFRS